MIAGAVEITGCAPRWRSLAHACRAGLPTPLWRALVSVPPPADPEEHVFRDCVARAALDAIGHTSSVGIARSKIGHAAEAARIVAEARAWFAAEHDDWRSQIFEMANYDEGLIRALVNAQVRRIERAEGIVVATPARESRVEPAAEMPGAAYEVVRGPRRPFAVERIKRRVSIAERDQLSVIRSYVSRSAAHASAPR